MRLFDWCAYATVFVLNLGILWVIWCWDGKLSSREQSLALTVGGLQFILGFFVGRTYPRTEQPSR